MKAQGLLSLDLPHGFNLPDPARAAEEEEEDPLDAPDQPEFSQDFLAGG
jgi:segregation and condensation protein B